jgi:hypothetical protein
MSIVAILMLYYIVIYGWFNCLVLIPIDFLMELSCHLELVVMSDTIYFTRSGFSLKINI